MLLRGTSPELVLTSFVQLTRISQRWGLTQISILCQGPRYSGSAPERFVPNYCPCDHFWVHLSGIKQVSHAKIILQGCSTCTVKLTYFSAFNAIISASVVALGVSYGIPIAINCIRGRKMLPPRPFVLPGPLGWIANLVRVFRGFSS